MRHEAVGRASVVVIASIAASMVVTSCAGSEPDRPPSSVAADADYTESVVPITLDEIPTGIGVAQDGQVYVLSADGLVSIGGESDQARTVASELPSAYGFAVMDDDQAIVGNFDLLEVVDLSDGSYLERPVANIDDIWGIAAGADGNVYVTGAGRSASTVIKFGPALTDPVNLPFPGLSSSASIAAGPDGSVYVVSFFDATVVALRPGTDEPAPLELDGADGPTRVATNSAGDLFILDSTDPGNFSTDPIGVRLLRYPAGATTPVELATFETNAYQIAAGHDGSVYYTRSDGDGYELVKLTPKT